MHLRTTTTVMQTRAVDLSALFNNVAATPAAAVETGGFNVWGNSFAADHLPDGSGLVMVDGIEFALGPLNSAEPDNIRCYGQYVDVVTGNYDWLYVIAAAERRIEDEIALHFADDSVDFEPLRLSDFWVAPAVFGETVAFQSPIMHYPHHAQFRVPATMWCQRVPVTRRAPLAGVRLPRNPAVHVFAATLQHCGREAVR